MRVVAAFIAGGLSLTPAAGAGAGAQVVGGIVQGGPPQVQVQEQRPTALVTGKVMCSDTQRPARFAMVMLIGTEQVSAQPRGGMNFGRRLNARTDLDGNFAVQAEAGDYYVTAMDTGYASTVAEIAARLPSGATEAEMLAAIPQVHVADGSGGTVNLTIDRGAVISGKLQWDDGSPATGVSVNVMSSSMMTSGNGLSDVSRVVMQLGGGFNGGGFQNSDDRGEFRVSGLAPGSYLVRATVMTPSVEQPRRGSGQPMTAVTFYAPGKIRRSEAQTITLKSGEERDDVVFALNLAGLHTVSGQVGATGSETVASGFVRVADTQDSSFSRQAMIQPDGSFALQWIPPGSYTLSVMNASNMAPAQFGQRGQQAVDNSGRIAFQPFQESLTVTDSDVSGLGISLTPVTNTAAAQ
jgi:hypothetical protein